MRIHTVVALYVLVFSAFFQISKVGYATLFLAISGVMAAEMFNTVAEELSDMAAASFNPVVRIIKDMAAGGVLICAIFAVAVGVSLFWQPAVFLQIIFFLVGRPILLALFLLSVVLSVFFIALGPTAIRDILGEKMEHKE